MQDMEHVGADPVRLVTDGEDPVLRACRMLADVPRHSGDGTPLLATLLLRGGVRMVGQVRTVAPDAIRFAELRAAPHYDPRDAFEYEMVLRPFEVVGVRQARDEDLPWGVGR